ncbi:CopG family transcriptional regulator [Listeria monocytogenes]|nr:CopG family transcriptional regulator [Listeria monocytogenes]EEP3961667.1 CopG family transcriptional regulator [Listeria monocytogenes]EEP3961837.1 CopG family transcriptional regulator [Listeria monocytogenes]EGR9378140.1 CopG family transcriptional regulator [Listeria monocytogenes]EGT7106789.1 CopG family transcriptional regulator [Listeria monocytogenes]
MEKKKKRLTITLAESVLDDLEKMAKEKGLCKSALITIALGEYKKGQKWA